MNKPIISVIIPVYNGDKYISECLRSIIEQNYKNIEIIVVNDGSDDNTPVILNVAAEADNRVTISSQANKGLSAARNRGIELAKGEYLVFVDADDMLIPDALSLMLNAIQYTDADICQGQITRKTVTATKRQPEISVIDSNEALLQMLYQNPKRYIGSIGGRIYRKSLFNNLRFREGMAFEDLALLPLLYLQAKKIAAINIPVYYYRENPDSFLSKWSPARFDVFKAIDYLRNEKSLNSSNEFLKALKDRELSAAFNMLLLLDKYSVDSPEIKNKCVQIIRNSRKKTLFNRRARLKNRIGAGVSYLGLNNLYAINRILKIVK